MGKHNFANIAKNVRTAMKKRSPEILIGIGIAGMVTTTVMAVKATPKALMLMGEKKEEMEVEVLDGKEIIKTTWSCYIPAALVGVASICCIIGASSTNFRRNAALATAYTLSESKLKEYQEKVVETIGEKKEQIIREEIAGDKVKKAEVREVILTNQGGHTKCYDVITDRYFESDKSIIEKAVNDLNRRMRDEMYITLNEFYDSIGLEHSKMGDMLGWNIDKGYIDVKYSSNLDANGVPILVLDYIVAPVYDYQ